MTRPKFNGLYCLINLIGKVGNIQEKTDNLKMHEIPYSPQIQTNNNKMTISTNNIKGGKKAKSVVIYIIAMNASDRILCQFDIDEKRISNLETISIKTF